MEVGSSLNEPFIYIDIDAILLSNLNEWWSYVNEKYFIGTMHYPIGKTLNAGIYSVSDPTKINFNIMIKRYFENRPDYKYIREISDKTTSSHLDLLGYTNKESAYNEDGTLRSGDQSLFVNYFIRTNETPYYDKHDIAWNVFSNYATYEFDKTGYINVTDNVNRLGLEIKEIKILHAYSFAKAPFLEKLSKSEYYR